MVNLLCWKVVSDKTLYMNKTKIQAASYPSGTAEAKKTFSNLLCVNRIKYFEDTKVTYGYPRISQSMNMSVIVFCSARKLHTLFHRYAQYSLIHNRFIIDAER